MGDFFLELTILVCIASFLAIVFRILKQPPILAYILTGILIGPLSFFNFSNKDFLQTMAELGVTLLLFMIGLELRFSELRTVGKVAVLTGIGQIVFTSVIGYLICIALGFSPLTSLYLSIALTFSSTIIIVKLLSDKKDLNSLYGKISVGFLLVQDFFAIIFLIFLSGFNNVGGNTINIWDFLIVFIKGAILLGGIVYLSKTFLPKLVDVIARSPETLFLFSIAWAFGLAALVSSPIIGFSIEIGGFLAGLSLANSSENFQIASKIKPLRDFFITIFFVILGTNLVFNNMQEILLPSLILSTFVLIGNPLIVMAIMGFMGYRKRTSFLAGLTVAQISEFSLILVFLGQRLGHLDYKAVSLITAVGIITFTLSTYMIVNGNKLYLFLSRFLGIFERRNAHSEQMAYGLEDMENLKDHVVLVGADQMGQRILDALGDLGKDVVVIDFDPDIVRRLGEKHVRRLFGDIGDYEIQKKANLDTAKLVISTIPDTEDNLLILKELNKENRRAKVVVMALDSQDAKILYKAGADYVILPHLAGGRQIARLIRENNLENIGKLKEKDLSYLV
ncbi:MAG: cation:proton antiporter [Candidatus Levybacteria bacterium]|nr:cation:proton antiporter [Candidatus Levybacteria bacterium]